MKLSYKLITLALAGCVTCGLAWADDRLSTRQLRDMVKKGDTGCMAAYGERLLEGDGTDVDIKYGRELMQKAAEANRPDGKFGLGLCFMHGCGGEFDLRQAYNYLFSASEAGYKPAFNYLGHCYEEGLGVSSNYHEARRCFSASADDLDSQCMLVQLLDYRRTPFAVDPREVGQNVNQALAMFNNAENVAVTPAVYGFLYNEREQSRSLIAQKITGKKRKDDDMSAADMYNLGRLYELALAVEAVTDKDSSRQMWDYYKRAAERKYIPALIAVARLQAANGEIKGVVALKTYSDVGYLQAKLALLDLYETHPDKDSVSDDDYVALLQELRQKGYNQAAAKLANYYAGAGSDAKAWQYTLEAADAGEALGCYKAAEFYRTGKCEFEGITVTPDLDKAYLYLNALCRDLPRADYQKMDMCRAFTTLGNMYFYGKGCVQDKDKAEEWYNVALNTKGGIKSEAAYRLGCLYIERPDKRSQGAEMLRESAAGGEYAKSARYLLQKYKMK